MHFEETKKMSKKEAVRKIPDSLIELSRSIEEDLKKLKRSSKVMYPIRTSNTHFSRFLSFEHVMESISYAFSNRSA